MWVVDNNKVIRRNDDLHQSFPPTDINTEKRLAY